MSQLIRLSNCRFSVSGPTGPLEILHVPELNIASGERVAVHGPSGSGKTTLLHLLSGLLIPTSGEVEVANVLVNHLSERERDDFRAKQIGYIFQSFNLLPGLSAIENIQLVLSLAGKETEKNLAHSLLAEVGLEARIHHHPDKLSIGEQQRVAIARALATAPALLLADEPTGSLDEARSQEIITLLEASATKHGCTLIVVSHDSKVLQRFPRQIAFAEVNLAYHRDLS